MKWFFSNFLKCTKSEVTECNKSLDSIYSNYSFTQKESESKEQFKNILDFADLILEKYDTSICKYKNLNPEEHPIIDVIKALGLNIKANHIVDLMKATDEIEDACIDIRSLYFSTNEPVNMNNQTLSDLKIKVFKDVTMDLKSDLILPWPWKKDRLIKTMTYIGKGRLWKDWKQDFDNHFVTLWLPMGIGWVEGGNHSIATGIISGQGEIKPEYIYDIRPIFKYVYCDGEYYRRIDNNESISPVKNIEFAAIFEIGRKMAEKNICYKSLL